MSDKPTLVFIHGSWHSSETWDKVCSLLRAQQYKCVTVDLPSGAGNASIGFGEDVKAVRDLIIAETTQGHDVVVVVHSYGGLVGESAVKGLTPPKKDAPSVANEPSGHVIGLALIATGFSQTGISFIDNVGGKPPPFWKIDPSGFAILIAPPKELFYQDLPEEEGDYWVSKLKKQSLKALLEGGEHVYSGWMDVPVWILVTTVDTVFPLEVQRMYVQMAKDAGADITMREVESSHSPMLSKPKETVDFLLEAVTNFVG